MCPNSKSNHNSDIPQGLAYDTTEENPNNGLSGTHLVPTDRLYKESSRVTICTAAAGPDCEQSSTTSGVIPTIGWLNLERYIGGLRVVS
ncbi:MAG: Uncharacterised protein [Methanobacteriota archaeon]|nr:MAG: Uncharacterised protein [Euryarchaeota archaeon]